MRWPTLFVRQRCHGRPTARAHRRARHRAAEPERPDRVRPNPARPDRRAALLDPWRPGPRRPGLDRRMRPGHEPVPHCRTLRLLGPRLPRTPPIRRSSPVSRSARCARLGTKPGAPDLVPVRIADLPHGGVAPRRLLGRDRWRPPGAGCRSGSGLKKRRSLCPDPPEIRADNVSLDPLRAPNAHSVGSGTDIGALEPGSWSSVELWGLAALGVPGAVPPGVRARRPTAAANPSTATDPTALDPATTGTAGGLGTPRETRRSPTRPPEPDG